MSTTPLPLGAHLEHLKKQAKRLLKAVRAGNVHAIARVAERFPEFNKLTIDHAQLVIAREYGFNSWAKLKTHLMADMQYRPVHYRIMDVEKLIAEVLVLQSPGTPDTREFEVHFLKGQITVKRGTRTYYHRSIDPVLWEETRRWVSGRLKHADLGRFSLSLVFGIVKDTSTELRLRVRSRNVIEHPFTEEPPVQLFDDALTGDIRQHYSGIVMVNDDTTPMDVVVTLLRNHLDHEYTNAIEAMRRVHLRHQAVVGLAHNDKVLDTVETMNRAARLQGHALVVRVATHEETRKYIDDSQQR
ncbi:MAG: ATP-dependent Clp protease adaptor ClpS [Pseudomonadota bacterium]